VLVTPAEVALLAGWAPTAGAVSYLAALTLLSRRPPALGRPASRFRFVIVVPAHDEAGGVAATVESLLAVDYPAALRRVVVIADNCLDDTAARARAAGADVMVRHDPARRGKGHALSYAFDRLLAEGWADAVVVVDADTVVSPNLLDAFTARLAGGALAVQAEYAVRNPAASWRTLLMAVALGAVHSLRSLARERLLLSCGLRGNGMCFSVSLLRAVPHDASSIVEDLEYGIRLGEAGHRVHYAHEARVYGEMPAGEAASRTQRRRWEGGRWRMARAHAVRLLVRGARLRDRVALDLALDLLVPPLATLVAITALGLAASAALSWRAGHLVGAAWAWLGCGLGLVGYALRGWQLSGTGIKGLLACRFVPGYVAWKLLLGLRRSGHADREWVRTARADEAAARPGT
jgi:cellulose synthase/poly-beta-1,6-N-acetylglucosamine synthase-like glycosyltransferase